MRKTEDQNLSVWVFVHALCRKGQRYSLFKTSYLIRFEGNRFKIK